MAARILVTGGFGFLGSFLVEELLASPANSVHVVDDLSTSPLDHRSFIRRLADPDRLTYTIATVQDFSEEVTTRFDEIYHLASIVGPAGILPHAGRIAPAIVRDTARLTELALAWGARILDVSTSEVYGGGVEGLCREDTPKVVPASVTIRLEYAVGKIAAETALINASRVAGLHAVVVRPFNIAGRRQSHRGGFVLARFARQALRGEDLTVFGDGSQQRAFTHVQDVARCVVAAMQRGRSGEVYNVGNPANRTTILDLARRVIALSGSRSRIALVDPTLVFGPLYAESPDKYPDATKAMTELAWVPRVGIDDLITDALAWAAESAAAEETVPRA